jgi:NAD-dependent dihydropyrimidine dehydrogenase PreA subunit
MVGYPIEDFQSADCLHIESEKIVPLGFLSDEELTAFFQLTEHRRALPIYLGDCWRCYLCTFDCFDFFDMVDHVFNTHGPEPFNEADEAELGGRE